MRRVVVGLLVVLAILIGGSAIAFMVATRTNWGRERVRRIAVDKVRSAIDGTFNVQRIDGRLPGHLVLHGVSLAERDGSDFLRIREITARLAWRNLFSRQIDLSDVRLQGVRLFLVQAPSGRWNYERLFPRDSTVVSESTPGFGDWIRLRNVQLTDGEVVVRRPWTPEASQGNGNGNGHGTEAASSAPRMRVEQFPGESRYEQVMTISQLGGKLESARVADPEDPDMKFVVDSLRAVVAAFEGAPLDVRRFAGTVVVADDSTLITPVAIAMPGTLVNGRVVLEERSGDIRARLNLPRLSFADIQSLYPPLPVSGGGSLELELAIRDSLASEYGVRRARLQTGTTEISGDLSLRMGTSGTEHLDTDLTLTRFPSTLLEQLVPGIDVEPDGVVSGQLHVSGALERLTLDATGRAAVTGHPSFGFAVRGGTGVADGALLARSLRIRGTGVPLSLLREFDTEPPVGGVVHIAGVVSGSTSRTLAGRLDLTHVDTTGVSHVRLDGRVSPGDGNRISVAARLDSVSLRTLVSVADSVEATGVLRGTARVEGRPDSLGATLALLLPGDGKVDGRASWQRPPRDSARYSLDVVLANLDPKASLPAAPSLMLNGTVAVNGRGLALATAEATARARLTMVVDSTEVRDVVVDARASEGLLQVDTLSASTPFARMVVRGSLGLRSEKSGSLSYEVAVDDLAGLERWTGRPDTGSVPPRPGIAVRMARDLARRDSAVAARREAENPAAALAAIQVDTTRRPPRVPAPPPVQRDSTFGSFRVEGQFEGNTDNAKLLATLTSEGVSWNGHLLGAGTLKATWGGIFTETDTVAVTGGVDSLRVAGFAFDSTRFNGHYTRQSGEGDLIIGMFPGDTSYYRMETGFRIQPDERELRLRALAIQMDSTLWRSTRASRISWREDGLTVDSLDLRNEGANGRIVVNGELPASDPGRLDVSIERVRVAPWLTIAQSDVPADGVLSGTMSFEGTSRSPTMKVQADVDAVTYANATFPDLAARLDYANERMQVDVQAMREDRSAALVNLTGQVPIDLRLVDSLETRVPKDGELALRVVGDSIPLGPLPEVTPALANVQGHGRADLTIGGTWETPRISGSAGATLQQATLTATGAVLRDGVAAAHFAGDTLVIDTLHARSEGTVAAQGRIVMATLLDPRLDLQLRATDALVLNDERGKLAADGTVQVRGHIDSLTVGGDVRVRHGVIYLPEPESFNVIDTQDPAIFAVADSTLARELGIEGRSQAMENMRLDVGVTVQRGVFARSADANVEIYGDLRVRTQPGMANYLVTGSLQTDRGDYRVYGKRFLVTRGSVRFVGSEQLNPSLQVVATYEVQQAGRAPLDIRVIVGGTLEQPTLTLESDAQPTLSQSDLIAFLAFGRNTSSLLQFAGTGLESGGSGGTSLAGNVAALATRQIASIGIGALMDELRTDLAAATRADVLNITPAQLPAEVSLGGLQTVLRGTEIELGRYLNERTFILGRLRTSLALPGASLEHRLREGLQVRASIESRIQGTSPSLSSGVTPKTLQVLGAVLLWTRSW